MLNSKSNLSYQVTLQFSVIILMLAGIWVGALVGSAGGARNWIAIAGLVALVVTAGAMWSTLRRLQSAFRKPIDAAAQVVAGELTQDVDVNADGEQGELLRTIKALRDNLFRFVSDVRTRGTTVAGASAKMS